MSHSVRAEPEETVAFWRRVAALQRQTTAANRALNNAVERIAQMSEALERSQAPAAVLDAEIEAVRQELFDIDRKLHGNESKGDVGEPTVYTVGRRLQTAMMGTMFSTYGPTPTHIRSMEIAEEQFGEIKVELNDVLEHRIPSLEKKLQDAGAPWVPGSKLPE